MSALEKVLRLAEEPELAPDPSELVRAACEDLDRAAYLLASDDEDDDGEGDDDSDDSGGGHSGHPAYKALVKKGVPAAKASKMCAMSDKKKQVKASQAAVLGAMIALSALAGGEEVSLSVLTAEGRRKAAKAGYTIPGSEDYPIPDAVHLAAAVARYKQGKFAGHPASTVRAHILKHARRLGKQVELSMAPPPPVLALARGSAASVMAMHHAPYSGTHSHGHYHQVPVDHEHTHNGDNDHSRHDGAARMGEMY